MNKGTLEVMVKICYFQNFTFQYCFIQYSIFRVFFHLHIRSLKCLVYSNWENVSDSVLFYRMPLLLCMYCTTLNSPFGDNVCKSNHRENKKKDFQIEM